MTSTGPSNWRNRTGRPCTSPEKHRKRYVKVYLTEREFTRVVNRTGRTKLSTWARKVLLGDSEPPSGGNR